MYRNHSGAGSALCSLCSCSALVSQLSQSCLLVQFIFCCSFLVLCTQEVSARVDDKDFSSLSKWLSTHCTRPYMMLGEAFCEAAWRTLSKWHRVHHGHLQLWVFSFFLKTKKHELGRVLWGRKCTEGLKKNIFFHNAHVFNAEQTQAYTLLMMAPKYQSYI